MDDNAAGAEFLRTYPMDDAVRAKVSSENAQGLLGARIPAGLG
jgi:2,3-dihydroxybenzoate decarboxylase